MSEIPNKNYDLKVIEFCKELKKTTENIELIRQLIRSVGSVEANYIEANEALSKKDFKMRIKICRKESKGSRYWLGVILKANKLIDDTKGNFLFQEASEFIKIFNSILTKSS